MEAVMSEPKREGAALDYESATQPALTECATRTHAIEFWGIYGASAGSGVLFLQPLFVWIVWGGSLSFAVGSLAVWEILPVTVVVAVLYLYWVYRLRPRYGLAVAAFCGAFAFIPGLAWLWMTSIH
jgi:hypothetical protein